MSGSIIRNRETIGAVLLLVLAIALRMVHLDRQITSDEVILYGFARLPLAEIYGSALEQDPYFPLGAYVLHLWMSLGTGPTWTRLYFVLFGVGLCVVAYLLGRELLKPRGALLVLAAAALSPILIAMSQYIRNYVDAAFWSALGLLSLVRIWRGSGGLKTWLTYGGATLIAFYTSYITLLVSASVIVWLGWRVWREHRPWRRWIVAHAVIGAGILPGVLIAWYQIPNTAYGLRFNWSETGFQIGGLHVGSLGRNLSGVVGFDQGFGLPGISQSLPAWALALLLATVALGCGSVFWAGWRQLKVGAFPAGASLATVVVLFPLGAAHLVAELGFVNVPHVRYFLVPHILFLVLMVAAVTALPSRAAVAGACTLVTLAYSSRLLGPVYQPQYDARGADRFIATIDSPETIVLLFRPSLVRVPAQLPWFDVEEQAVVTYDFASAEYRMADRKTLDTTLDSFTRVAYVRVYSNQEIFRGNAVVMDYLAAAGFTVESTEQFRNIDVMIFERRRPAARSP